MVVAPAIIDGFPKCDVEAEIVNSDGVQIPVRIVSTKICDDDGHYKGTVVVFQDLRSTRELVEAKRQESLAIMSAGIAHDFNNLLTVAGGYVELCQKGLDHGKSSRQTGYLGEASFALAQARSLTGQLMTFSRGGDPVRRNVSVERLVEESAGLVLAGTSVALVKQIEPGLWPVCVDPVQTGQVFNNLMLNAVQSMTSGGTLTTRLTNLRGDGGCPDMVRIQIEDTGCGIPQSIIERIFDSFFTARKGGTGLGLASVKSIINRHGGSISVQSTVGRGSIFTVDLPRGSTPDFSQTILVNTVSASNGRVLVMDDVDSVRRVAVEMLRAIGYDADSVEDGDQAVRVVKSRSDEGIPWDVVILDVTVQGGTGGIAALADIKRVQPNIGTVVSSGYSEGAELSDFKGCGFDSRLPKPYTLENLATAVAGAMEKHKSRITGQE
jgi:nitrogen-specific signal transduction histidine kinase/ActR/RegA family two-component response regulator